MKEVLYVVSGTTASGKTTFAIDLALEKDAEILSCDASLFYRGMDIGTAKPSIDERRGVKHWGIDIIGPNEHFSVYDYLKYAERVVREIRERGKQVIIVGGSGFYLRSFFGPIVDNLNVPKQLSDEIAELEKIEGFDALVNKLKSVNELGFPETFDIKNPRRVRKALARCLFTGKSLIELKKEFESLPYPFSNYEKKVKILKFDKEELNTRIELRVEQMLNNGLISEVEALLGKNLLIENTPASKAIGYHETINYLQNTKRTQEDLLTLKQTIIQNTKKLAKKQRTWLKSFFPGRGPGPQPLRNQLSA